MCVSECECVSNKWVGILGVEHKVELDLCVDEVDLGVGSMCASNAISNAGFNWFLFKVFREYMPYTSLGTKYNTTIEWLSKCPVGWLFIYT